MSGVRFGRVRGRLEVVVDGALGVKDACEIARAALDGKPTLIDLSRAERTGPLALLDSMLSAKSARVATVGMPLSGIAVFQTMTAARRWMG